MSNIYICQDTHLQGILAVKEFTARYANAQEQQTALIYFKREADLLHGLSHPNLPRIHDYFQHQGLYYIAMDFVEGEDLGKIFERNPGPHSEKSVAEWAVQVATVLYYLHCQKPPIIFRDIKPSNIILNNGQVKLIDFGIARCFRPEKKGDTMRIGSPGYAPPEQYNGQSDPRSDIYALGATMHQALTGIDPTASATPFVFKPVREVNPQVSETMANIVTRALKVVPEERYQSMVEMKRELRGLLQPQLAMTRPASAQPALSTASQDLLKSTAPTPAAVPTPVGSPATSTGSPVPATAAPNGATTAGTAKTGTAKAGASPNAKASGQTTPAASAPKKRWGCIKAIIVIILLLVVAIFFGPALTKAAIKARANYLGIDARTSYARILYSPYLWNILRFPEPLACASRGGQLFINGAPPADCLKALNSETFSPLQLIYTQDVKLVQQTRLRQTVQQVTSKYADLGGRFETPLDLDSVDIALLVPSATGKNGDWGGQCLVGTAVAQQYLSDWSNSEDKVKVLLPLTYTKDNLPELIASLDSTDIRRTISYSVYNVNRYRPNFALVFYQRQAENDPMLTAIVTASQKCSVPLYAVGMGNSSFSVTAIQQGVAGTSWSYTQPTLGQGEVRADMPQSLPVVASQPVKKAKVSVSPFHPHTIGAQAYELYQRLIGNKSGYALWPQAFDALCLALCSDQPFQGLMANFSPDGKAQPITAASYTLQGTTWLHAGTTNSQATKEKNGAIPPEQPPAKETK